MSEKEAITKLYNHYKEVWERIKDENDERRFINIIMETYTYEGMCVCSNSLDIDLSLYNWFDKMFYLDTAPHHVMEIDLKRNAIEFRVNYLKQLYEKVISTPDPVDQLQPDNSRIKEAK